MQDTFVHYIATLSLAFGDRFCCIHEVLESCPTRSFSSPLPDLPDLCNSGKGWWGEFNCYSNAVVDSDRRCEKCVLFCFGFGANSSVGRPVLHEHTTKFATASPVRSRRTSYLPAHCRIAG